MRGRSRSKRRPRALERHHGHAAEPRQRGVYQYHRATGLHPHPQRHAASRRLAERPSHVPASGAARAPAPLHHHQHVVSDRHLARARQAAAVTALGQIAAYDAATGTATVQVLGSLARLIGPVPVTACAPRDLSLIGASCLMILLDANNPQDGVVVATWPAPGTSSGAKLTQTGVASLGVAGASSASATVPFPTAYAGAPAVVATSTDPNWAATVASITAGGFTLTIHAATALTATVPVEWIACGQ